MEGKTELGLKQVAFALQTPAAFGGEGAHELGCVWIENNKVSNISFEAYIHHERLTPSQLAEMFQAPTEQYSDMRWFDDAANDFLEFVSDAELVSNDLNIGRIDINSELHRLNLPTLEGGRLLDVTKLAEKMIPGGYMHLVDIAQMLGIDIYATNTIVDCAKLIAQIYLKLDGDQLRLRLAGGWPKKQLVASSTQ